MDASVSDCPAWSEEGMIHWLYDRCERRLQKAVTRQDPYKTNQYLARQGMLSDMLTALEVATTETRGHIQQVLEDITDLSSDEDSPTINTGGHATALNSGVPTGIATAFVHGVAGMSLCGCDIGDLETSDIKMIPFTTLVLTAWTMALGGYTWCWLRQPIRPVIFPPTTLVTHPTAPEPEVNEDPQIEGRLLTIGCPEEDQWTLGACTAKRQQRAMHEAYAKPDVVVELCGSLH